MNPEQEEQLKAGIDVLIIAAEKLGNELRQLRAAIRAVNQFIEQDPSQK